MSHTDGFVPPTLSYSELVKAIADIEELLYQFQAEIVIHITKHVYPYTVEIIYLNGFFQLHIFTLHDLFHLCYMIEDMILSPF